MMKKILWCAPLAAAIAFSSAAGQIYDAGTVRFLPSDNGSDTRVFKIVKADKERIEIDFTDQSGADNYLHIDCGKLDLLPYWPGGYLEIDAELDRPVLRLAASFAEPGNFWPTRVFIEQEAVMEAGRHKYRIYLDTLTEKRLRAGRDHFYLFLHDMGGESKGNAKLTIHNTRLVKEAPGWQKEKNDYYRRQYKWRNFLDLGKYYRGKYDRLVPFEAIAENPFVSVLSLSGEFEKSYLGDITWSYAALADTSFAAPGKALADSATVTVPEKAVEGQRGGHYLYRKTFQFSPKAGEAVYLRIGDLADTAEIFLNGQPVGTQTSVRKRHEWVLENGSRQSNTWGKPVKEVARFQHFERCGFQPPFDEKALPDDHTMLLPIYTGEYTFDYAFDVSGLLKEGGNTLTLRLYGNPVTSYWIYGSREDRAFRNVFGILGDVELYRESQPAFPVPPAVKAASVADDGMVERIFFGQVSPSVKKVVAAGQGMRLEMTPAADGSFSGSLRLPAGFGRSSFLLTALQADGRAADSRTVEFNDSVIELRDGKLYVNGDRFVIRGINSDTGIEWDNGRKQTRRRWLQVLANYKQLGFNALRIESATQQQLKDALDYGFLVMPVYAAGSCNTTEVALGNLDTPDHEFNTDAHKEMVLQLAAFPNVLFWNSGNENHHTPGYNDKVLMDEYLDKAQQELKRFDPDRRPVTYANLDTFGTHWFFTAGQDVLGYNSYQFPDLFTRMMKEIYRETGLPIVFCEWGLLENETKGTALRKKDVVQWEKDMKAKLDSMRSTPGCVGGFLYAHHGEFSDVRGREFLQKVMSPYRLTVEGQTVKFENQDVATLRKVSVQLVTSDEVVGAEWAEELKPGRSLRIACPAELRKNDALRIEISFETHRGLKQKYTRMVNRIEEVK